MTQDKQFQAEVIFLNPYDARRAITELNNAGFDVEVLDWVCPIDDTYDTVWVIASCAPGRNDDELWSEVNAAVEPFNGSVDQAGTSDISIKDEIEKDDDEPVRAELKHRAEFERKRAGITQREYHARSLTAPCAQHDLGDCDMMWPLDAAAIKRGKPTVNDVKLAIVNSQNHNWLDPTWVPFYWTCTLYDPKGQKAGSGRAHCASQAMAMAWLLLQAPDALTNCSIEDYDVELDVPNGWRFECTPPKLTLAVAIAWLNENYAEFADVELAAGRPAWLKEAKEDLAEASEHGADVKWTQ